MPKQRHLDLEMMKSAKYVLNLKANKKMIQNHFVSCTGKAITMKDMHNIAETDFDTDCKVYYHKIYY